MIGYRGRCQFVQYLPDKPICRYVSHILFIWNCFISPVFLFPYVFYINCEYIWTLLFCILKVWNCGFNAMPRQDIATSFQYIWAKKQKLDQMAWYSILLTFWSNLYKTTITEYSLIITTLHTQYWSSYLAEVFIPLVNVMNVNA